MDAAVLRTNGNNATRLKEETLIASWLSQKNESNTRRNYLREVKSFFKLFPDISLREIDVGHLSVYLKSRSHLSIASQKKSRDTLSSLLSFCVKVGYLARNPAFALGHLRVADKTAFRILSEEQVLRMILMEKNSRNQLLIKLLYVSGLRVSELCQLKWKNFSQRTRGVQLSVVGKGNKARSILISKDFYNDLEKLKMGDRDSAVFRSQMEPYNSIQPNQVRRIVSHAAKKARLPKEVSPHWLRHCHATHALERGAPIHIVQSTLGHASLTTTGRYLNARPLDSSSHYLIVD